MLRRSNGTVTSIAPKEYTFFSAPSLIRDEALLVVQERRVAGKSLDPNEYYGDVTPLRATVAPIKAARLAELRDSRGGPRLQCDWAGTTCIRVLPYEKNRYFAHRAEIVQNGTACELADLPDRVEQAAISRVGNSIAFIARPNPYKTRATGSFI